jgi:hypothetical protein
MLQASSKGISNSRNQEASYSGEAFEHPDFVEDRFIYLPVSAYPIYFIPYLAMLYGSNVMPETSHHSYIFFLVQEEKPQPVARDVYVSLLRHEAALKNYAGKKVRVADLYIQLLDGAPHRVENETFSHLYFDENGYANPHDKRRFSVEENRAFYDAALSSRYSDIACDTEVQKVREELADEFNWLPDEDERRAILSQIFT